MAKDDGDQKVPEASSISKRKLVENEVMSRKPNEKISKGFDFLNEIAEEDGQTHLVPDLDPNILFFCECSDENCKERIELKKSMYDEVHQDSKHFLVLPGHNVPSIERVIHSENNYTVVEKFEKPPENVTGFHATDVNKSRKKS